jgi:hypothetical protein
MYAEFLWRCDKEREDPDFSLVPFANYLSNYDDYLASDQWASIREEIKQAAGGKCRACPKPARDVHHRDYRPRVLAGRDHNALVALCRSCHRKIEKMKVDEGWGPADRLLRTLVAQHESATGIGPGQSK